VNASNSRPKSRTSDTTDAALRSVTQRAADLAAENEQLRSEIAVLQAVLDAKPIARMDTPWMTVRETADYLRCGKSVAYALTAADGPIPAGMMNSERRVHRDDLDAYLRSSTTQVG
jgi:excisionase family DNA binding protein